MEIERRWVTVTDNSLGNIDDMLIVKTLVDWYSDQGLELSDYASNAVDRLAEGQTVLNLAESYISGQALDAIRTEWLAGWLEYICDLGDIQVHEDYSDCYGYWEDAPAPRQAIKFKGQFHCPTCGSETQDNGWCSLCRVYTAGGGATLTCTRCKAKLNNEGYCPDPHCPYSELFES